MEPSTRSGAERRARFGVGMVTGGILGAITVEIIYHTGVLTLLGTFLGMILGAAIGARLRSEVFQFIWIEYSSRVAMRFTIAMLLFTALIVAAFYFQNLR